MKAKRLFALLLALTLCLSLAPAALAEGTEIYSVSVNVTYDQTGARSMLAMINDLRADGNAWQLNESGEVVNLTGLGELQYSYALEEIAMQRAAEVALSHSHTRPDGSDWNTCTASDGTRTSGENICAGYGMNRTAAQAFETWCETDQPYSGQGHRRNMLKAGFQTVGIAHVTYNGTDYWVQEFGYTDQPGTACSAPDGAETRTVEVSSGRVTNYGTAAVEPGSLTMTAGETTAAPQAGATLTISNAFAGMAPTAWVTPDWQSADENVVTAADGSLTAVGAGQTTLSAVVFGNQTVTVSVTVTAAETETLADGFYLIRPDWTVGAVHPDQKFVPNPGAEGEYFLATTLTEGEKIKVVRVNNGGIDGWWPDGMGNEYTVKANEAGYVTIYFRETYNNLWSGFGGYFYIDKPESIGAAEIYGSSLSLKGNIGLNFYVFLPTLLLGDSQAYVTLDDQQILVSSVPTDTINGRTAHRFSASVTAKDMHRKITLKVFTGQGEPVTLMLHSEDITETGYSYSVQDFLDSAMATVDALRLLNLARAMNDYGSCAQHAFRYKLDDCSDLWGEPDKVTAEMLADFATTVTPVADENLSYAGSSLLLRSNTAVRHYFKLTDGEIDDYVFAIDGATVIPVQSGNFWYVELEGIVAKELGTSPVVTVTKDGQTIFSLAYGPMQYAYKALSGGTDDADVQLLVKSLYCYWQAAKEYFAER